MRIAICDDEDAQRQLLKGYLEEWSKLSGISLEMKLFQSGENFMFFWEEDKEYDLLIFDVGLGRMSGLELAAKIRQQDNEIPILFVTGYDEYISQGYEVAALHYLVKPLDKQKFFEVLDRVKRKGKQEVKLLFKTENGSLSLPLFKIWYVEARAHQCVLYTDGEEYMIGSSISEMEEYLGAHKEFIRCHRSYVVNLRHVSIIVKSQLTMDDGRRLPVSRSMEKGVNQAFIDLYRGSLN